MCYVHHSPLVLSKNLCFLFFSPTSFHQFYYVLHVESGFCEISSLINYHVITTPRSDDWVRSTAECRFTDLLIFARIVQPLFHCSLVREWVVFCHLFFSNSLTPLYKFFPLHTLSKNLCTTILKLHFNFVTIRRFSITSFCFMICLLWHHREIKILI